MWIKMSSNTDIRKFIAEWLCLRVHLIALNQVHMESMKAKSAVMWDQLCFS